VSGFSRTVAHTTAPIVHLKADTTHIVMTIVERAFNESELPEATRAYVRDRVTLGWEDRTHVHGRRRTDGGVEFGTALPRGTVLRGGDFFVLAAERLVVAVVERAEPVFVIEPRSAPEWALFAYHIGNRHQPVMITERSLVCPDAPGLEQLLQQHRMPYSRATLPFTPGPTVAGHRH
jgi:urease accessory protein